MNLTFLYLLELDYNECKRRDELDNINTQKIPYYDNPLNINNKKVERDYLYYYDNADDYSKQNICDLWVFI